MAVCVSHFNNNHIATTQFGSKLLRALQQSSGYLAAVYGNNRPATVDGQRTIAIRVDDSRFNRVMDNAARALTYHIAGFRLTGQVKIVVPDFVSESAEVNGLTANVHANGEQLLSACAKRGDNPQVFFFQFAANNAAARGILRMTFFEGLNVYALWT